MKSGAQFIVDFLYEHGVTDVFGVPGGVILDLLSALDNSKRVRPHLCYGEQDACFAAIGFAQAKHTLGACYCTRGPGLTNMLTPIADAYFDSVPIIVFTAHGRKRVYGTRCDNDQELDVSSLCSSICKKAVMVETPSELPKTLKWLTEIAMSKRRGPVIVDIFTGVFSEEIQEVSIDDLGFSVTADPSNQSTLDLLKRSLVTELSSSSAPVFLLGDGVKQRNIVSQTRKWLSSFDVPVISSRFSVDAFANLNHYFGYVGSHGCRVANYILSKSDLIICLGNRLNVPLDSNSFSEIVKKRIVRVDIDEKEFNRSFPNSLCFLLDIERVVGGGFDFFVYKDKNGWLRKCDLLKTELIQHDSNSIVSKIEDILSLIPVGTTVVCDVGNNEFWVSYAVWASQADVQLLFSKSFGVLGCSLGKAIGAFFGSGNPVVVFTGDQGFQFNIQELETIAHEHLPITIVILNNRCSGMIRDAQKKKKYPRFVHTTFESGYSNPSFFAIAKAYGIEYRFGKFENIDLSEPNIVELQCSEEIMLEPYLENCSSCENLSPRIADDLKKRVDYIFGENE